MDNVVIAVLGCTIAGREDDLWRHYASSNGPLLAREASNRDLIGLSSRFQSEHTLLLPTLQHHATIKTLLIPASHLHNTS